MDKRPLIAWVAVLSSVLAVALAGWTARMPASGIDELSYQFYVAWLVVNGSGLVWAVTGGVLVSLRPRNVLSWLILTVGVSLAWAAGLVAYGTYGWAALWPGAEAAKAVGYALEVLGDWIPLILLPA